MKNSLLAFLCLLPIISLVLLDSYISYLSGTKDSFFSEQDIILMLAAGVACAAVGFLFEKVYAAILSKTKNMGRENEMKYTIPKILSFATVGLVFWFIAHFIESGNEHATKKCFETYNEKDQIKHCIESGEMVPESDATSF